LIFSQKIRKEEKEEEKLIEKDRSG
jgi:hypothetical protein